MPVAIVTGASKGLGKALATGLADRGWSLVLDARGPAALAGAEQEIRARLIGDAVVRAVPGDVTDAGHRRALTEAAEALGGVDLLVQRGPGPVQVGMVAGRQGGDDGRLPLELHALLSGRPAAL